MRAFGTLGFLAGILGGCATVATEPARMISDTDLATNPFDTAANRPDILLTAQLAGHLEFNGTCVLVRTSRGIVTPLWPEGTRTIVTGKDQVITLPDGRGSVTIGQKVSLAGGAFPTSDAGQLASAVRTQCPPTYFAVSSASS